MPGKPGEATGYSCPQCGCSLPRNARFCGTCGHALSTRAAPVAHPGRTTSSRLPVAPPASPLTVELASGRVRCASFLLDLAAMISPAMPLSIAGAVLGVPEVVYIVVPVAFVAVWMWMQIWQGFTGTTFGKAMLGLRLAHAADYRLPGLGATLRRSLAFIATFGLAGLPVLLSSDPQPGWHDRISGLTVLDVATGANPFGQRQQPTLRRPASRGLNRVHSPIPVSASRHR